MRVTELHSNNGRWGDRSTDDSQETAHRRTLEAAWRTAEGRETTSARQECRSHPVIFFAVTIVINDIDTYSTWCKYCVNCYSSWRLPIWDVRFLCENMQLFLFFSVFQQSLDNLYDQKDDAKSNKKSITQSVEISQSVLGVQFKNVERNWIHDDIFRYDAHVVTKAFQFGLELNVHMKVQSKWLWGTSLPNALVGHENCNQFMATGRFLMTSKFMHKPGISLDACKIFHWNIYSLLSQKNWLHFLVLTIVILASTNIHWSDEFCKVTFAHRIFFRYANRMTRSIKSRI